MTMHAYTSITSNYLPKARVLARTLKKHQPDCRFHLILSDKAPAGFELDKEPFDTVIGIEELGIPNWKAWMFKHSVVELCTAVKGFALLEIFRRFNAGKVFYFDPDMAIFSPLTSLSEALDSNSILLTPHQSVPESDYNAILDNEVCSLKHGVFNLGFVGVKNSGEGLRFASWWAERLRDFCYADIPAGLFTDQRWVDLAPCFFDELKVLREPIYNVATWNLTNRQVAGSLADGVTVNGAPLCFYHFSGFDSGAQEIMLNRYGANNRTLRELRDWYIASCETEGQASLGKTPWAYGCYENGERIGNEERLLYRNRQDLRDYFPEPFSTADVNKSYCHWFRANVTPVAEAGEKRDRDIAALPEEFQALKAEMQRIVEENHLLRQQMALLQRFRGWRLFRRLSHLLLKPAAKSH